MADIYDFSLFSYFWLASMSRQLETEGDAKGVAGKNGVPSAESHLGV
jgi:hypothetical protein